MQGELAVKRGIKDILFVVGEVNLKYLGKNLYLTPEQKR